MGLQDVLTQAQALVQECSFLFLRGTLQVLKKQLQISMYLMKTTYIFH